MKKLKIGPFRQQACAERPLHQVDRALRARFWLWIQNGSLSDSSDSIFSQLQGEGRQALGWVVGPETHGVAARHPSKERILMGGVLCSNVSCCAARHFFNLKRRGTLQRQSNLALLAEPTTPASQLG